MADATLASAKTPEIIAEEKKKDKEEIASSRARYGVSSELLFVILPFIVIAITLGHRGELRTMFFIPEWSIVSAVIVGQTIVRLASVSIGRNVEKEAVVFMLSVLLVCLLVPILVVLAVVLTSDKVSFLMALTQSVFFIASALAFAIGTYIENRMKSDLPWG